MTEGELGDAEGWEEEDEPVDPSTSEEAACMAGQYQGRMVEMACRDGSRLQGTIQKSTGGGCVRYWVIGTCGRSAPLEPARTVVYEPSSRTRGGASRCA